MRGRAPTQAGPGKTHGRRRRGGKTTAPAQRSATATRLSRFQDRPAFAPPALCGFSPLLAVAHPLLGDPRMRHLAAVAVVVVTGCSLYTGNADDECRPPPGLSHLMHSV